MSSRGEEVSEKKALVPSAAQQAEAEKSIKEIFGAQLAKNTPADKLALAEEFDRRAAETKDDIAGRYEFRVLALGLAAKAGAGGLVVALCDKLDADFAGDFKELERKSLATAARDSKDPSLGRVIAARQAVLDKPGDPAANLVLGRYECFVQGNWKMGLARLSHANPELREIVGKDQIAGADSAAQNVLGDAWWDLGEKEANKEDKALFHERAAFWYRAALPEQNGIAKAKNEKRIAGAETASAALLAATVSSSPAHVEPPTAAAKPLDSVNPTEADWADGKDWAGHIYNVSKHVRLNSAKIILPGTELINSTKNKPLPIDLGEGSKLFIFGQQDLPVTVRGLRIGTNIGSEFYARWTIFENCAVGGGIERAVERFRNCVFRKCVLHSNSTGGYCAQYTNCMFIDCATSEMSGKLAADYSSLKFLETNKFTGCYFFDCALDAHLFWSGEQCSYIGCKFPADTEYESTAAGESEAYIVNCTGMPPTGTKERKLNLTKTAAPYPPPLLPVCAAPDLSAKVKQAMDLGKGYRWISKNATCIASSTYQENVPSPKLLNGEGGAYGFTHSFHTNADPAPWIVLDLGRRRAVAALEIENRSDNPERADTLTACLSDSADGPWEEVWHAKKVQAQWEVLLDHPSPARFVKLGLKKAELFHLNHVRIFEK